MSPDGAGGCSLDLDSPRVFGLATPGAERLANAALTHDSFAYAAADLRASVRRCPAGGETKIGGGFATVYNADEVLSVFFSGFVSQAEAAHPGIFGPETVTLDLRTGRRLSIGDLVSDEAAFREAILGCAGHDPEEYSWGTKDAFRKAPRWVVVPGGIAVVLGDVSPVMHGAGGTGPIASFAGLMARQLLRKDSPVARLWASEKPVSRDAPLCPTNLGRGEIITRP